jgi:hypothetical protein
LQGAAQFRGENFFCGGFAFFPVCSGIDPAHWHIGNLGVVVVLDDTA